VPERRPLPLVIAHRGASADEHENSLAAFRRAVELGADGVELDVHATSDGGIIVYHDADLEGEPIRNLKAKAIRECRLPNGERVPTLADALAIITPYAEAFVEVKGLPAEADDVLLALFDAAPHTERCHVHSFDHRIIQRLTEKRPTLNAGILSGSYTLDPTAEVQASGASVLWQQVDLIDVPLVAQVHAAGYRVFSWTVDAPARIRRLAADGVDGICTNRPDVAREALG
jgi:glycerophosphoryl diester phosphodiesterase